MKRFVGRLAVAGIALVVSAGVAAADTIKVGVLAPFSGPMAIWGEQFRQAIDVYVAQNGTQAGEHTIEFIYKDAGFGNPDLARSLAQELLIRDRVDYLAGFVFTPDALAVAPLINQAKKPAVIFNAGLSEINARSDYFVRVGFTLGQVGVPMADWARGQGVEKVVIAVADFGPGIDAETTFGPAFAKRGGAIVDTIRMPLQTTDFTPFMQRIKDSGADAVFTFLPSGPSTYAFVKAYDESGLADAGVRFLGTGETDETMLDALGDAALGLYTSYIYSEVHQGEVNDAFRAKLEQLHPGSRANLASTEAWDGTHLIYQMVKAAGADGAAAVEAAKGLAWESPRGPVSIEPSNRHITQNVYIRVVERTDDGRLVNREIKTYEAQPDHSWAAR